MYNFKENRSTFKGLAGECMFKATRNVFITRFFPIKFILRKFGEMLNEKQIGFITKNWLSFDAIEFGNIVTIYEVKTRNIEYYYRNKICTTQNTINVLKEAETFGFNVKFAIVLLYDNWNYKVEIKSIQEIEKRLWINTNNNYDKIEYSQK